MIETWAGRRDEAFRNILPVKLFEREKKIFASIREAEVTTIAKAKIGLMYCRFYFVTFLFHGFSLRMAWD